MDFVRIDLETGGGAEEVGLPVPGKGLTRYGTALR